MSLKVVFICPGFPVLTESFIYNKIVSLSKRGNQISVIAPHSAKEMSLTEVKHQLPHKNFNWDKTVHYFDKSKPHTIKKIIQSQIEGTDIFHFEYLLRSWGKILKYFPKHIPKVVEVHGHDIYKIPNNEEGEYRRLIRQFDAVIAKCGDAGLKTNYLRGPVLRPSIHIINPGINFNFFRREYSHSFKKRGPINIVSICRFVEKKGIKFLLTAMPHIIKKHNRIKLRIYGEGPLKKNYLRLIRKHKLQDHIFLEPPGSPYIIRKSLNEADLFVLPCIKAEAGDQDTSPNVIAEAMAMGLPVVSTWMTGIPEIIEHGKSGLLVQPKDVQGLIDAITFLIERPDIRKNMGDLGRKKANNELNMNKQILKYCKLYQSLLK